MAVQMADLCEQLHEDTVDIMQALGEAVESRDQDTSGHVEDVAWLRNEEGRCDARISRHSTCGGGSAGTFGTRA
jgi:hypothetical protein